MIYSLFTKQMGDGDQTGHSQGNIAHSTNEFQAAPHLSHKLPDPKDERTVDNRVEAEKLQEKMENIQDAASAREQRHPTTRAQDHGSEWPLKVLDSLLSLASMLTYPLFFIRRAIKGRQG